MRRSVMQSVWVLMCLLALCGAGSSSNLAAQGMGFEGQETPRERMERERRERLEPFRNRTFETPEQRVERLKRELENAEAAARELAATAQAEATAPSIPTGALVVVSSDKSEGSGFIAKIKGRTFFVTNIHVLGSSRGARYRTIDGETVPLASSAFLSKNRDIAIVPIEWEGPVMEVSQSLRFDEVAIGQAVTVMGNSSGARVATRLSGSIQGLGPDEIEVSAKFEPGNSGSPIVHNELGTVIGVASHMRDLSVKDKWTRDSELADIRRFGYRLDGEIEWEQFSLAELQKQAEAYDRFTDRTFVMAHISYMLEYESILMTGYRSHDSLGYLFDEISESFDARRATGSSANQRLLKRLVDRLLVELQNDRISTEAELTVSFYRSRFQKINSSRDRLASLLQRYSNVRL